MIERRAIAGTSNESNRVKDVLKLGGELLCTGEGGDECVGMSARHGNAKQFPCLDVRCAVEAAHV